VLDLPDANTAFLTFAQRVAVTNNSHRASSIIQIFSMRQETFEQPGCVGWTASAMPVVWPRRTTAARSAKTFVRKHYAAREYAKIGNYMVVSAELQFGLTLREDLFERHAMRALL